MKAVVAAPLADAYHEQAEAMLAAARGNSGLVFGEIGRQIRPDSGENIIFVTVWADLSSLYEWVGANDLLRSPTVARLDLVETLEIQHYETWDPFVREAAESVSAIEGV